MKAVILKNNRFTNINGHLYAEDTYLMNLFGYHISNNNAKGTSNSSSGKTSNSRGSVGSSAGTRNMGNSLAMHPSGSGDSLPYGGGGTGGMPIGFEAWLVQVLGGTLGLVWGNKSHALPSDFDEDLLINFYIHHMTASNNAANLPNDLDSLNDNDKHHILQDKHNWNKLVPDPKDPNNWDKVASIISYVLANGDETSYKSAYMKSMEISGEIVNVTFKIIDSIMRISDAWVK